MKINVRRHVAPLWLGFAISVGLSMGGCTNAPPGAQDADPPAKTSDRAPSDDDPVAEPIAGESQAKPPAPLRDATFVETWLGKPPMAFNYFDLTFENPASEPRWLVFTEVFHYEGKSDPVLAKGDVAELNARVVGQEPRVVLVQGVGANFYAVKLEGSATLRLEHLPIQSWWQAAPAQDEIEVIVATQLRVDGKPIESVVSEDLLSGSGRARVPRRGEETGGESWHPAQISAAKPIELEIESRAKMTVTFAAP